jgi:hypothetical protein
MLQRPMAVRTRRDIVPAYLLHRCTHLTIITASMPSPRVKASAGATGNFLAHRLTTGPGGQPSIGNGALSHRSGRQQRLFHAPGWQIRQSQR